jgi:hypothetical protein
MASVTTTGFTKLGSIVTPRGVLGEAHSRATSDQMGVVAEVIGAPSSFSTELQNCVICVEDRFGPDGTRMHAPRLAGGALALGLMWHFLYGGDHLSDCLGELKKLGFYLVLHEDCGALKLAPTLVPERLSDPEADGYKVLQKLGLVTDTDARTLISAWAKHLPEGFFDIDECRKVVDEVEDIVGEHNAVAAVVSLKTGESFVGGPTLSERTNGLLAFAFDPWAARVNGQRMGVALAKTQAAIRLGQVFTAEVLLQLAGPDLSIVVHE